MDKPAVPPEEAALVRHKWNEQIKEQLQHLLDKWGLALPKMIISVTGGADRAQVTLTMQKEFRRGLLKAASSTEAWIVTGGTGSGVMEQVGLAARAQSITSGKDVHLIGIAPFEKVYLRKTGVYPWHWPAKSTSVCTDESSDGTGKKKSKLDRNHSHFILVLSNDKERHYEDAIDFRVKFEKMASELIQKKASENDSKGPVPIVLIMFEGGNNTLRNVQVALKEGTPVVIIKGSGRAADVLAFAYEEIKGGEWDASLQQKVRKKCEEKNIPEDKLEKCMEYVGACLKQRKHITVFELTSHTSVYDVDRAILKALLNSKGNVKEQMRLAILWNRFDIAQNDINIQSLESADLQKMTKLALSEGRAEFLDMFLDNHTKLEKPDVRSLAELFLASDTSQQSVLVRNICEPYKMKPQGNDLLTNLEDLLLKMIGEYGFHQETETSSPERDYLLWAVLMNRMDLAYIFWRAGKEKILAALVVSMTLKAFVEAKRELDTELQARFKQHAEEWSKRAGKLLLQCHEVDEDKTRKLLVLESDVWGNSSCVLTALRSDNKRFTSLHPCRSLRRLVWEGKWPAVESQTSGKSLLSTLRGRRTAKVSPSENQENSPTRIQPKFTTWAPRIIYHFQWLAYLAFLTLYSYMVLVELDSHFTWVEVLISVWVFAIAVDVGVQFKRAMERPLGKPQDKLVYHLSSPWTVLDLVSILAFVVGLVAWASVPGASRDAGRVILALDLIVFFLRFLYYFTIDRYLGPKLVMFGRMMTDLALLSIILFVFIFGYAIASEAILYPNTALTVELLYSVPRKAFWQIFGEFFLDDIEETSACSSDPNVYLDGTLPRCPSSYGRYVVPILMAVYIVITNLLLLNLFIAMFTHTFTQVQEETDQHWQFLRMRGVYEMSMHSPLPAPLNLLYYLWSLLRDAYRTLQTANSNKTADQNKTDDPNKTADPNPFQMKFPKKERQELIDWEDAVADTFLIDKSRKSYHPERTTSSLHIANTPASSSEA